MKILKLTLLHNSLSREAGQCLTALPLRVSLDKYVTYVNRGVAL